MGGNPRFTIDFSSDEGKIIYEEILKSDVVYRILPKEKFKDDEKILSMFEEIKDEGFKINETNDKIETLNLSARSYNCLKRAGIRTIEDFSKTSIQDLGKVRNLGKKCIDEIIEKLAIEGITLEEVREVETDKDFIDLLELSTRSYNCLNWAGIRTIEDFSKTSIQDLGKVRNLGKKGIDEIIGKLKQQGIVLEDKRLESEEELIELGDIQKELVDGNTDQIVEKQEQIDYLAERQKILEKIAEQEKRIQEQQEILDDLNMQLTTLIESQK